MKKQLILLMLIIPIIAMVALFSTSKQIGMYVDVDVSRLEINNNKIEYLDTSSEDSLNIDYTVYPTNATNKEVTFTLDKLEGEGKVAEISNDGVLTALNEGKIKVYATSNVGNHQDSIIVEISSDQIADINLSVSKAEDSIYVGDQFDVIADVLPKNTPNKSVSFISSNSNVVKITDAGKAIAVSKGYAKITATSDQNRNISKSITIEVKTADVISSSDSEIVSFDNIGEIILTIDLAEEYTIKYIHDETKIKIKATTAEESIHTPLGTTEIDRSTKIKIQYELLVINEKIDISVEATTVSNEIFTKDISFIQKENVEFELDKEKVDIVYTGSTKLSIMASADNVSYTTKVSLENNNITVRINKDTVYISSTNAGSTEVTIEFYIEGKLHDTKSFIVISVPKGLNILENANTYGINSLFTMGKYSTKNNLDALSNLGLNFSYNAKVTNEESFVSNYIRWSIDEKYKDIASIDPKTGLITVLTKSGNVEIKVSFVFDGIEYLSDTMTINCMHDGYNVYNYNQLMTAANQSKKIILQTSIGSANDGGAIFGEGYANTYSTMKSTYDINYYKNMGNEEKAMLKVLINFRNDVNGNGYTINAHNIAFGLDSTGSLKPEGKALFRGPLNFVAMSDSGTSMVSVKAQDNVSFAIHDNVSLNNVIMQSCDTQDDLTRYNYVGTTVEVFGDNVDVLNSRIKNGRIVMRVFGAEDPNKEINLNIQNSILSNAREFIMRIGSNKFKTGNEEEHAPYLNGLTTGKVNESDFKIHAGNANSYNTWSNEQKTAYDENYITTHVTLDNVALNTSGIFSIGMDAHFAGRMLAGVFNSSGLEAYFKDMLAGWKDLAATSYGAKLTLKNDVRIYDWKSISSIDSSTLIDVNDSFEAGKALNFDIKAMIESYSKTDEFKSILSSYNGKQYAHGGIAFFGGGKNYSVIDYENFITNSYANYTINLDNDNIAGGENDTSVLTRAAGTESFYFLMYDNNTPLFTPSYQTELEKNNNMYSFIINK